MLPDAGVGDLTNVVYFDAPFQWDASKLSFQYAQDLDSNALLWFDAASGTGDINVGYNDLTTIPSGGLHVGDLYFQVINLGTAKISLADAVGSQADGTYSTPAIWIYEDGAYASFVPTHSSSVTVTPTYDAPMPVDDHFQTPKNTPFYALYDIWRNDILPEGVTNTQAVLASQPLHGHVEMNYDGSFMYWPDKDFEGSDSFGYYIRDVRLPGLNGPATVTIDVGNVNVAPVANDDSVDLDEDTTANVHVLANDYGTGTLPLVVDLVDLPQHGTVALNAGVVAYTPDSNYFGSDSFTYKAVQGSAESGLATVHVNVLPVNDPPEAAPDSAYTDLNTQAVIDVLYNDSDVDGNTLSIASVTSPAHGSVSVVNGRVVYTPRRGFRGTDTFTYTVTDGSASASASVTIAVQLPNRPPVAVTDVTTVGTAGSVNIDVLANDRDPDRDPLQVTAVTQPQHGSAVINQDGTVAFTPAPGFRGHDSFTYTISDGRGGTSVGRVILLLIR